jgi:hypothetical protein
MEVPSLHHQAPQSRRWKWTQDQLRSDCRGPDLWRVTLVCCPRPDLHDERRLTAPGWTARFIPTFGKMPTACLLSRRTWQTAAGIVQTAATPILTVAVACQVLASSSRELIYSFSTSFRTPLAKQYEVRVVGDRNPQATAEDAHLQK